MHKNFQFQCQISSKEVKIKSRITLCFHHLISCFFWKCTTVCKWNGLRMTVHDYFTLWDLPKAAPHPLLHFSHSLQVCSWVERERLVVAAYLWKDVACGNGLLIKSDFSWADRAAVGCDQCSCVSFERMVSACWQAADKSVASKEKCLKAYKCLRT